MAIRSRARAAGEPVTVLGYVETQENGRRKKTDTTKDYTVQLMNEFEPAATRFAPVCVPGAGHFHASRRGDQAAWRRRAGAA